MSPPGPCILQAVAPQIGWEMPAAVFGALMAASIIIYILIRILTHRHEGHGPKGHDPRGGKPPMAP